MVKNEKYEKYEKIEKIEKKMKVRKSRPVIGIDFGNSNSTVSVFRDGHAVIIPDADGHAEIPSYVDFDTLRVGHEVKQTGQRSTPNVVYNFKRLIGRRFNDPDIFRDNWTFPVFNSNVLQRQGIQNPSFLFQFEGRTVAHRPEEIASMVFGTLRENAERYLNTRVTEAVITIPSQFTYAQRHLIQEAAKDAGLNVLCMIKEPAAVALEHSLGVRPARSDRTLHSLNINDEKNVLVFDVGAGHTNVAIVNIGNWTTDVKSTASDMNLGGDDFDDQLINYFVGKYRRQHNINLRSYPKSLYRLRIECENAKCTLSSEQEAQIHFDNATDSVTFDETITRQEFEQMCQGIFRRTLEPVQKALQDAYMEKAEIDDILVVGGSTLIPKIRELLREFFDGKELNTSMDPFQSAAKGASIQAAVLTGVDDPALYNVMLMEPASHSLGIEIAGHEMYKLIGRNIGWNESSQTFTKQLTSRSKIEFRVFEGEGTMVRENNWLGTVILENVVPAPSGTNEFKVTFEEDVGSKLKVTVRDRTSGRQSTMVITGKPPAQPRGANTDTGLLPLLEESPAATPNNEEPQIPADQDNVQREPAANQNNEQRRAQRRPRTDDQENGPSTSGTQDQNSPCAVKQAKIRKLDAEAQMLRDKSSKYQKQERLLQLQIDALERQAGERPQ